MKVAVLTGTRRMTIEERPDLVAGPGEVIVEVARCGICGSDVQAYLTGKGIRPGTVMGHECVGTVVRIGSEMQTFKVGDRVAVKPVVECGICHFCRRYQFSICPQALKNGLGLSPEADGAYASHIKIPWPDKMLFPLPDNISFDDGVFIEPLATSLHGVRLSKLKMGDNAVVIGAGTIGLGVIQFLRRGGARKIIVVEPSPVKRNLALQLKADAALDPHQEQDNLQSRVLEMTEGLGAEMVFECAGAPQAIQVSYRLVKRGGQVLLIGVNHGDVSIQPFILTIKEIELKGVFGYGDEFSTVIDFMQQKRIDSAPMLTDVIPLDCIESDGFQRLTRKMDLIKVVVRPNGSI